MIDSYKKLEIYKRSYNLALKIHEITKSFPETERYDLTSQIRRASKSIPTNIAEGYGRQSKEDFKRFLKISLGSCNETQVHLEFCKDLKYIDERTYNILSKENEGIGKMINVTISKWKQYLTSNF